MAGEYISSYSDLYGATGTGGEEPVTTADARTTVEGFSVTHAAVLDGTTGAEETDGDIYGVREGSIQVDDNNYDNTGDEAVLSRWFWFNYAQLTVTAGYIPFKLLALISGAELTSSGTNPDDWYELPLWTEDSLNQPTRPVLVRVPSKDADGNIRTLDIVLYKVQFMPFNFNGPNYKEGLVLNYSGSALLSNKNEKGDTLSQRAIGRLISRPKVLSN